MKKATFEENMTRLEEIVSLLEQGDAPLSESLALFSEGSKLLSACQKELDTARQKVVKLTKGPDGAPVEGSTLLPAGRYLLATYTCPNCKRAADMMDQAGIAYEEVFAEEYPELVEQLGVMQAPTLVDVAGDGSMDVEASGAMQVFKRLKDLEAQA